jgi:molecular chaperone GrpE (heat shock protein)
MCSIAVLGCGQKADEEKPMSEVKAEAEKMNTNDLRAAAMKYKEAIVAKKGDLEKLTTKLKEIPMTEMLGEQAKGLKADIDNLNKSISALKERFNVYYEKLKEAGGDLSGLQI